MIHKEIKLQTLTEYVTQLEGVAELDTNRAISSATLKIRGGCERDCYGKKAGKGALIQWEKSGTLGVSQDQTLFVWRETATAPPIKVTDGVRGGNVHAE